MRGGRTAAIGRTARKVVKILNRRGAASPGKGVHSSESVAQKPRKSAARPTRLARKAKTSRRRRRGAIMKPAARISAPAIGVRMKIERCETSSASGAPTKATTRPRRSKRLAASATALSGVLLVMGPKIDCRGETPRHAGAILDKVLLATVGNRQQLRLNCDGMRDLRAESRQGFWNDRSDQANRA